MDVEVLLAQLLDTSPPAHLLSKPLPDAEAAVVVERLKQEVDRHWWIDANRSLELARLIVQIGQTRRDLQQVALGMMAAGDSLRILGRIEEAWETLQQAADHFKAAGDEVGWARTCIGRLPISIDLNCVDRMLEDAKRAEAIFERHGKQDRLLRLHLNAAVVYNRLGDHQTAVELNLAALAIAEALDDKGQAYLGLLYTNIGYAYILLGEIDQASAFYDRALAILTERGETSAAATAELNIAYVAQMQGHYRKALQLLHHSRSVLAERYPIEAAYAWRVMVECYILLNRYEEARALAQQCIDAFRDHGATNETALTLRHLAVAEAMLANDDAAQTALDEAETIFRLSGAETWATTIGLRRGRIALRQHDIDTALQLADTAIEHFEARGRQINRSEAILLRGQARFAASDLVGAAQDGRMVLDTAQKCSIPSLRYSAHMLLGRVAEAQGRRQRAACRYRAAGATVDRVQRGLTITLRPGFLEDKGDALRALIALRLQDGDAVGAFEALERAKSQVLLGYLTNRESLRWSLETPHARSLADELEQLRQQHHWLYQRAHGSPVQTPGGEMREITLQPEEAITALGVCEKRMRAITEQLYLQGDGGNRRNDAVLPTVDEIQRSLFDDTVMVAFYNDGAELWAFTLDGHGLEATPLPLSAPDLDGWIHKLEINIVSALRAGAGSPAAHNLTRLLQRIAQQLYAGLLKPLARRLHGHRRLVIVPYGSLHYLPFHLLHTGKEFLIEQCEVVVLPTAGLISRPSLRRDGGALILAHSWNERLPNTLNEAKMVQALFGGDICHDHLARRTSLHQAPRQLLHIAAHGEHRIDQPDLSYIQLDDGQLYTDDLLQYDLSYELVILSACETGRARVAAGDELIGLGRGFLYAGAGALITSLWRVSDAQTVSLMTHLLRVLSAGASKAAALRDAQQALLHAEPNLHPAFWGAFQLVGDASPLSVV